MWKRENNSKRHFSSIFSSYHQRLANRQSNNFGKLLIFGLFPLFNLLFISFSLLKEWGKYFSSLLSLVCVFFSYSLVVYILRDESIEFSACSQMIYFTIHESSLCFSVDVFLSFAMVFRCFIFQYAPIKCQVNLWLFDFFCDCCFSLFFRFVNFFFCSTFFCCLYHPLFSRYWYYH